MPTETTTIGSLEGEGGEGSYGAEDFAADIAGKPADPAPNPTPSPTPEPPAGEEDLVGEIPEGLLDELEEEEAPAPPAPTPVPPKPGETSTPAAPVGRNLDGIPANLHRHFRNMDNKAYSALKPLVAQFYANKERFDKLEEENRALTSTRFFDHEEGYTLNPEFRSAAQNVQSLEAEGNFWTEQLSNIRQEQNWQQPQVNPQTGEITYVETQPSPHAEAFVISKIAQAQQMGAEARGRVAAIQQSHQVEVGKYKKFIDGINTGLVDKLGVSKNPAYQRIMKQAPSALRNSGDLKAFAGLYAIVQMFLEKERKKSAASKIAGKIQTTVGASGESAVAGKPGASVPTDLNFEEAGGRY